MNKKVPLSRLSGEIKARIGRPAPSYRQLWQKVVDGELPADVINGRYLVDPDVAIAVFALIEKVAA